MKKISERIKKIRKTLQLPQETFAKILGVNQRTISNWENGRNEPPLAILEVITQKWGINGNWLLTGKGEMFLNQSPGVNSQDMHTELSDHSIDIAKDIITPDFKSYKEFDLEFDKVPLVEAQLSAGGGSFLTSDNIVAYYAFRKDWLQKRMINPKRAVLMRVSGDSMHPLIDDGDTVLVDLNRTTPKDGKIYAIAFGESIFLKKIQFSPPDKILLTSINPNYKPTEVLKQDIPKLRIIGQCLWLGKDL